MGWQIHLRLWRHGGKRAYPIRITVTVTVTVTVTETIPREADECHSAVTKFGNLKPVPPSCSPLQPIGGGPAPR